MNAVAAVSPTDAWAVGDTLENIVPPGNGHFVGVIEHFDGTQWSLVSTQFSGVELLALQAVSASDIFAVGDSNADGQQPNPFLAHYDGTRWSEIQLPSLPNGQSGALRGIAIISDTDIWVTGDSGGVVPTATLAMHFDGGQWSIVGMPVPLKGNVHDLRFGQGVTATATNDVWAVGAYRSLPFGDERTLTEHWDGKVWKIVHSPNGGHPHSGNELRGVSAVSSTDVWACGTIQDNESDRIINLIEHWDGARWTISKVSKGNGFAALFGMLAFPSGSVFAAGSDFDPSVPGQLDSVIFHTTQGR